MDTIDTDKPIVARKLALLANIVFASRQDMANTMNCSPPTIVAWCNGESVPNLNHMKILYDSGVDIVWLVDDNRLDIQGMFRADEIGARLMRTAFDSFELTGIL